LIFLFILFVTAQSVDRPVPRRRHQPCGWAGRDTLGRPAPRRDLKCLRDGLLGELEVAEIADYRGEDTTPLVAKDLFKRVQDAGPMTGRISMAPASRRAGMRIAISVAWSRSSASYT